MRSRIVDLSMEKRLMLIAGVLGATLLLLVTIGLIWMARFPAVNGISPSADSLTGQQVVLPVSYSESDEWLALNALIESVDEDGEPFSIITAKPLFWQSRRPLLSEITKADEKAESPIQKLTGVTLLGTYGEGQQGGAIISHAGKRLRLPVGEVVDGWTLKSIDNKSVQFSDDRERIDVLLLEHANVPVYTETPSINAPALTE